MIHTLTLSKQIDRECYNRLYDTYKPLSRDDKYNPKKVHHEIKELSELGITFDLQQFKFKDKKKRENTEGNKFFVFLRLNPGKVLGGTCLSVFQPAHYEQLKTAYNELTSWLFGECFIVLCDLENWKLRRCDYCVQLSVIDAPRYIKLMQRGGMPRRGRFFIKRDAKKQKQSHRAKDYQAYQEGSVYLTGGKLATETEQFKHGSYNVNFYDKQAQMKNDNKECIDNEREPKYTAEQISAAENILRLEIQCKPRKIDSTAQKRKIKKKSMEQFLSLDIAQTLITKIYKDIAGEGCYRKKRDAIKRINQSAHNKNVRGRLIGLLDEMTGNGGQGQSLWKLRSKIEDNKNSRCMFDSDVKKLAALDINAVPLQDNYKLRELPNLLPAIQQYFDDLDTPFSDDFESVDDLDTDDLFSDEE